MEETRLGADVRENIKYFSHRLCSLFACVSADKSFSRCKEVASRSSHPVIYQLSQYLHTRRLFSHFFFLHTTDLPSFLSALDCVCVSVCMCMLANERGQIPVVSCVPS